MYENTISHPRQNFYRVLVYVGDGTASSLMSITSLQLIIPRTDSSSYTQSVHHMASAVMPFLWFEFSYLMKNSDSLFDVANMRHGNVPTVIDVVNDITQFAIVCGASQTADCLKFPCANLLCAGVVIT